MTGVALTQPSPGGRGLLRLFLNPQRGVPGVVTLNAAGFRRARAEIVGWAGYGATPLVAVPVAGVGAVFVKDEGARFGLFGFEAPGGAYAVLGVVRSALARLGVADHATAAALEGDALRAAARGLVVCCASGGSHGRSVAWGARRFGARCVAFVHAGVSAARAEAIAAYGAEIRVVPGIDDDAVRAAAAAAEREGWTVVSDTSWAGYTEIPREVMQGYRVMVEEALGQMGGAPTHVFVEGGAGGLAAAVAVQLRAQGAGQAALVVVEPEGATCLLARAEGSAACGEPSLLAWQELERSAAAFLAISDPAAVGAMRVLGGVGVVSGESGAVGLAGLLAALGDGAARASLGLDAGSRVLAFSTEGTTA